MCKQKKALFTSHVANFVKFNLPYINMLREKGWEVHYASAGEELIECCDKVFNVSFNRSPFSLNNIRAYFNLRKIILEEKYDLIHCHTPMGGVVTRLAARAARKTGTKVIYTAHGLHFYKGAPLINWLLYYPVEKLLAICTDALVLINDEDYLLSVSKQFKAGKIYKLAGIGVNASSFHPASKEEKSAARKAQRIPSDAVVLLYTAEFIPRKNHGFLLKAFASIKAEVPQIYLLLAGKGELSDKCHSLCAKLGIADSVLFLGYRRDMQNVCQMADVLVSVSKQEGLPVNVLEGMSSGLPVICSAIRGHTDVVNGNGGFLYPPDNKTEFLRAVMELCESPELRAKFGANNTQNVKRFGIEAAVNKMAEIYEEVLGSL